MGRANEHPSSGAEQGQGKLKQSMDVRIFMLTIFLSVVFLGVAVTELLCCFKIIQDVASLAEWKFLVYYLLSEQFPSITIACFFSNSSNDDHDSLNEIETSLYSGQARDQGKDRKQRRHHRT